MGAHNPDGASAVVPAERVAAYRRAAARPSLRAQIELLLMDLKQLSIDTSRQDPVEGCGVALALAHGALVLAVTPLSDVRDRRCRADILRGTIVPVLASAGLDHVGTLVEMALAHEGHPACTAESVGTKR